MKIDEQPDVDYETVTIAGLGLIDHLGVMVLKSIDGREFQITAFSSEIAQYIANFMDGKREQVPTIYNMFEQMCEENEIVQGKNLRDRWNLSAKPVLYWQKRHSAKILSCF